MGILYILSKNVVIDWEAREIIHLVMSVCVSVWVSETYVVHHFMGAGLRCAPPACIVHLSYPILMDHHRWCAMLSVWLNITSPYIVFVCFCNQLMFQQVVR